MSAHVADVCQLAHIVCGLFVCQLPPWQVLAACPAGVGPVGTARDAMVCRHADGTLSKAEPTYLDLLSLPLPCQVASLLFVVNAPSGMLAGEAVFDAAHLSALNMRIKSSMLQVQPQLCKDLQSHAACMLVQVMTI